ncbi:MAG: hypothetical protein KDD34_10205, partial [Bdellovibrionales bacterium]|nr:hypothetical protein [Bdellovibrionales bacterium]
MKALQLLLITFCFSSTSYADESLNKIQFEQNRGYIVFDTGSTKGIVDSEDIIVNLHEKCKKSLPMSLDEVLLQPQNASTNFIDINKALNKIKLITNTDYNFRSNPIFAKNFDNNLPIFILFPDLHQSRTSLLSSESSIQNLTDLSISQAYDSYNMIEALTRENQKSLYTLEGSTEYLPYYELPNATETERLSFFSYLVKNEPASISTDLPEVFNGIMPTYYVDKKESYMKWFVAFLSHIFKKNDEPLSWEKFIEITQSHFNDFSETEIEELNKHFNESNPIEQSTEELYNLSNLFCDERSYGMANESIARSSEHQAQVVFTRIGASHIGGFIEILEKNEFSYIIF